MYMYIEKVMRCNMAFRKPLYLEAEKVIIKYVRTGNCRRLGGGGGGYCRVTKVEAVEVRGKQRK
jgi:hypothetical protein